MAWRRLSIGAVGLALTLLVSAAWGSGVEYLVDRLGLASPVSLAWMDGVHVYVGLVAAVLLIGKVRRVGLRHEVQGVPAVVPWQRWVSWSLLVLYGTVLLTGVLALLPVRGALYADVVNLHLIASVWALSPTTWHVWHYRRLAAPYLGRALGRAQGRRFWLGVVVAAAPALVVLANARGVSQLPRVMGGSAWSSAGLTGVPLAHLATTPDGAALVAAGNRVYVSRDGSAWKPVDFGPGAADASEFLPQSHGHVHGPASASATAIQSLAVSRIGVYVGTSEGMYFSPTLGGPLTDLGFPGQNVEAIAIDPHDPDVLWTASTAGVLVSTDGGRSWTEETAGLLQPETVTAVADSGGRVFASVASGVFEWAPASQRWVSSSGQGSVVSLAASPDGRDVYAASGTGELWERSGGRWRRLATPAPPHVHDGQVHALQGVVPYAGRLFAAGTSDGVSVSADGGQTWTQLGGGVAANPPGQVVPFRGDLWAVTSDGIYRYHLTRSAGASATWWAGLVAAAACAGLLSLRAALPPRGRAIIP